MCIQLKLHQLMLYWAHVENVYVCVGFLSLLFLAFLKLFLSSYFYNYVTLLSVIIGVVRAAVMFTNSFIQSFTSVFVYSFNPIPI